LTFDDSGDVLQFVNSHDASVLTQIGAACPDHLVHTKRTPLYINWNVEKDNIEGLIEQVKSGVEEFKNEYKAYFERNKHEGDQIFESAPRVILIPGIGMVNTGRSLAMANGSGGLYHRA